MKSRKILSLLCSLLLILSSLTSCARTPESRIEKADKALENNPYVMEIDLDFRCDDNNMKTVFEQLSRTDITVYRKGDDVRTCTEFLIDYGEGDVRIMEYYTIVDGMIYFNLLSVSEEFPRNSKLKSQIDQGSADAFVDELSLVGGISASDFSEVIEAKHDGDYFIICKDISEEGKIVLEKLMISQLESTAERVKLTRVELNIEFDGRRYDTLTFLCDYEITMSGKTYTVGMSVEVEFDYDEFFTVSAPHDADVYESAKLEDIIG